MGKNTNFLNLLLGVGIMKKWQKWRFLNVLGMIPIFVLQIDGTNYVRRMEFCDVRSKFCSNGETRTKTLKLLCYNAGKNYG